MKHAAEIVGVTALIVVYHFVLGCAHRRSKPDVSVIESRLSEVTLIAPPLPPPRVIRWDSAGDIPRDRMVWIEVFNGESRVPETEESIPDVTAYVDEAAERLGEVWVVVQRIHMKMQPIEKDREVIDACENSRARAVILRERIYLGGRLRSAPYITPTRILPDRTSNREQKAAQPGATDNPVYAPTNLR